MFIRVHLLPFVFTSASEENNEHRSEVHPGNISGNRNQAINKTYWFNHKKKFTEFPKKKPHLIQQKDSGLEASSIDACQGSVSQDSSGDMSFFSSMGLLHKKARDVVISSISKLWLKKLTECNETASNLHQCLWTLYCVVYLHGSPEKLKVVKLLSRS